MKMIQIKHIILILFLNLNNYTISFGQVLNLYEKEIPNSFNTPNLEETKIEDGMLKIFRVSKPSMTFYGSKAKKKTGQCVIICPGGGYWIHAAGHEGADVAKLLNSWGVDAFVLKYRIPDVVNQPEPHLAPLQDAQQAIIIAKKLAVKYGYLASKVGIMGFSAGGHLAASSSTHFDSSLVNKPNFSILIYPVISFGEMGHIGSKQKLLGPKNEDTYWINYFSAEKNVTSKTPPTFLVHSGDDKGVLVANSILYYQALIAHNIPAQMHLYPSGGHGYGLNIPQQKDAWYLRLKSWLQTLD